MFQLVVALLFTEMNKIPINTNFNYMLESCIFFKNYLKIYLNYL